MIGIQHADVRNTSHSREDEENTWYVSSNDKM